MFRQGRLRLVCLFEHLSGCLKGLYSMGLHGLGCLAFDSYRLELLAAARLELLQEVLNTVSSLITRDLSVAD